MNQLDKFLCGAGPLVRQTVIVVTRGDGRVVRQSLRSLRASLVGPVNLIVWDDASRDNTPAYLSEVEDDTEITLISAPDRLGWQAAVDKAVTFFDGPSMLVVCRSDVEWPRAWNAEMHNIYRQLFPPGALACAWSEAEFDGPGYVLCESERKVVQIDKHLNRHDPPAIMVSANVFGGLGLPENVGAVYDLCGTRAYVTYSVRPRRIDARPRRVSLAA